MRHCQRKVATDMCVGEGVGVALVLAESHVYLQLATIVAALCRLPQVAPLVRQAKERTHFTCGSVAFVV